MILCVSQNSRLENRSIFFSTRYNPVKEIVIASILGVLQGAALFRWAHFVQSPVPRTQIPKQPTRKDISRSPTVQLRSQVVTPFNLEIFLDICVDVTASGPGTGGGVRESCVSWGDTACGLNCAAYSSQDERLGLPAGSKASRIFLPFA